MARPVLKWVGGKTQLLPELLKRVPTTYGRYFEPFFGGGALFFALQPKVAYIGDSNAELIHLYRELRDDAEAVIAALKSSHFTNDAEAFYAVRAVSDWDGALRAARTIYLNKTCFNGLYRVNSKGGFNSPFGKYKNPNICDEKNLRAVSAALQGAHLWSHDFSAWVSDHAVAGDFVYFDPPYIPLTKTSNFTSYTAGKFGLPEQVALRDLALKLKERGVHILLSNSASPITMELYCMGFKIEEVAARRSINSKGTSRGPIKEYLIS